MLPLLPRMKKRKGSAGRPLAWQWREIMEAVFWILESGAQWKFLPKEYQPRSTVHYRFLILVRSNFFTRLAHVVARELEEEGTLNLNECFIDGTFVIAKRGGDHVGNTKKGKGSKIMFICEKNGRPVGVKLAAASPAEITLTQQTISNMLTRKLPKILIGDGAYDSDPMDQKLAELGISLVAPHRSNRVAQRTQDLRQFRRYKRRWKVERLNSWIQNFRRVLVRYERDANNYYAYILLAIAVILQKST